MATIRNPAIIILNWNSWELISSCLSGLEACEPYPVYVVDNGSEDESAALIRQRFPAVNLITSPVNLGFAQGNNLGIRRAAKDGCEAFFLLNNDTVIDEGFLNPCLDVLEANPDIGVVGPVVVEDSRPDTIQAAGGRIALWSLTFPYLRVGELYERGAHFEYVDYVLGAAMLIRKEVIDKIGYLDPEFYPAYVEEADLCYRARRSGFRSAVTYASRVRHIGGGSGGGYRNEIRRFTSNQFLFGLKHLNPVRLFVAGQAVLSRTIIRKLLKRF